MIIGPDRTEEGCNRCIKIRKRTNRNFLFIRGPILTGPPKIIVFYRIIDLPFSPRVNKGGNGCFLTSLVNQTNDRHHPGFWCAHKRTFGSDLISGYFLSILMPPLLKYWILITHLFTNCSKKIDLRLTMNSN